ncbi:MAG: hypothetical protein WCR49_09595 [Opitutae bacterium]
MPSSHLIFAACLLLVSQAEAQFLGARPLAANPGAQSTITDNRKPGPVAVATPAVLSRREYVWDGFPLAKQVITFARGIALEIDFDHLADWNRMAAPQLGIAWANQRNPQISISVSYLTGPVVRQLLAGNAWGSVPSGLVRAPTDQSRVIVDDDSTVNGGLTRLFGWRTRIRQLEITPAAPNSPALGQIIVVAGDESQAYLFIAEGPLRQLKPLQSEIEGIWTSLEPAPKVTNR